MYNTEMTLRGVERTLCLMVPLLSEKSISADAFRGFALVTLKALGVLTQ